MVHLFIVGTYIENVYDKCVKHFLKDMIVYMGYPKYIAITYY